MVVVAVEDKGEAGFGRIRLRHVENASAAVLTSFVKDNVDIGSIIRTDGWNGYNHLLNNGFRHVRVRKSGVIGDDQLPLVHRVTSLLKRWLLGTYQGAVQPSYLDYYLDEFTFRFNRRTSASRGKLFYRLIEQALIIDPVDRNELKTKT